MKKFALFLVLLYALAGALCTITAERAHAQTGLFGYSPETTLQNVAAVQALVVRPASVILLGTNTPSDGGGGIFYWAANDTTTPDNVNTIQPTNGPAGRYKRLPFTVSMGSAAAGGDLSGTYPNPSVAKITGSTPGYFALGTDAGQLTGTASVNRFNNGLNADSSHFLRGDGTWVVPPSASGAQISGSPTANQIATWLNGTTIQGVNSSTLINNIAGGVRQTVQFGPVSSSTGAPSFLPATTGSLSVTSQNVSSGTPLIITAANGATSLGSLDAYCSTTSNLTWSGLSANVTNYLYVSMTGGVCTAGSTTTQPVYQWGGTPSTTNGAFTFNISQMIGYFGNGSTAPQTYITFVGEASTGSSSVTSTVAYAYNGVYDGAFTNTLPSNATYTSVSHNIGITPKHFGFIIKNITGEFGYNPGDSLQVTMGIDNSLTTLNQLVANTLFVGIQSSLNAGFQVLTRTSGARASLTAANWAYKFYADRGW